jgi:hypothetical protein
MRCPRLRRLYPFVSHSGVNFSLRLRTGESPFPTHIGFMALPTGAGRFRLVSAQGRILGEGSGEYIADLLHQALLPVWVRRARRLFTTLLIATRLALGKS